MKTKTLFKISYYPIVLGWFPYMFIAAIGSHWSPEARLIVALIGFSLSFFGSVMSLIFLKTSSEIFKSIDELEELKEKYKNAISRYDKTSDELINKILETHENNKS